VCADDFWKVNKSNKHNVINWMIFYSLNSAIKMRNNGCKNIWFKCNFIAINLILVFNKELKRDIQCRMYKQYAEIKWLNLFAAIIANYEFHT
jgi:hypothetical protein